MQNRYSDFEELRPIGEASHIPDAMLSERCDGEPRRQHVATTTGGCPDEPSDTGAECQSCGASIPAGQTKCRFCLTNHLGDILPAVTGGAPHRPILLSWVVAGLHSITAVGVGISERSPVRVLMDCWQCHTAGTPILDVFGRVVSVPTMPKHVVARFGVTCFESHSDAPEGVYLPLLCLGCWVCSSDTRWTACIYVTLCHPKTALYPRPEGRGFSACIRE